MGVVPKKTLVNALFTSRLPVISSDLSTLFTFQVVVTIEEFNFASKLQFHCHLANFMLRTASNF